MRTVRPGRSIRFPRPERVELIAALHRFLPLIDVLPRFAVERRYGLHDGDEWSVDKIAAALDCSAEAAAGLVVTALRDLRLLMDPDHADA